MWIFSNFDLALCTTKVAFPCSKMSREGLQLFWKYSNCLWVSPYILLDILNMLFGCLEASETSRIKTYCLQNRKVQVGGKGLINQILFFFWNYGDFGSYFLWVANGEMVLHVESPKGFAAWGTFHWVILQRQGAFNGLRLLRIQRIASKTTRIWKQVLFSSLVQL